MNEIMKNPNRYVGREVTVSGVVTDVCAKRGCWMKLATDYKSDQLRIKVKDGEMVFPIEARGRKAVARGKFSRFDLSLEQTKTYLRDLAEENKKSFDPATVTKPMVLYQVDAVGVTID